MYKIKKRIKAFSSRLTSVSQEEPLNKLSLVTIIILDLFVLSILFNGLSEHTRQLTTANEYLPMAARNIFIEQNWTPADRISRLQPLILTDRNNIRYRHESPFDEQKINRMHPTAVEFYRQVQSLAQDKNLSDLFLNRQKLMEERQKNQNAFEKEKALYDTRLLENIAKTVQPSENAASRIAREYAQKTEMLSEKIRRVEQQIDAHPGIQNLWGIISPDEAARDRIVAKFKRFQFWFPLKELTWQLLFLLPIFCSFYVWSSRSVKKGNPIQTLIASHLLVIAALPIVLKLLELVIDMIPNHFFKNLFKILQAFHLMALWHYFVIFGSIAVGLFLVYFIQRKVFSRKKIMQKRLAKGVCIACSRNLPPGAAFCPFCGTGQRVTCTACGEETPSGGTCCIHCGASR
jgi:hypothetical protein